MQTNQDKELESLIDSTLEGGSNISTETENIKNIKPEDNSAEEYRPEIIDVKETDPMNVGFRLKKSTIYVILFCVIAGFIFSASVLSKGGKHIVSLDTDNFYYIYSVEDDNTCTLLIPSNKIPEGMKDMIELESGESIGSDDNVKLLLVPGVELTEKAKENVVITDSQLNIYGLDNLYTYEEGWGIFKHTNQERMDTLYLYTETAKRLGLLEGELNYDTVDENGNIISNAEETKGGMPDLGSLSGKEMTEEEFKQLQESLAEEGFSLSSADAVEETQEVVESASEEKGE